MRRLLNAAYCLIQSLDRYQQLSAEAEAQLELLCGPAEAYLCGDYMDPPGALGRPLLVVSGWAAELLTLTDGRRQVLRLLLQGDVCGLGARPNGLPTDSHALTDVTVADLRPVRAAVREGRADSTLAAAWRKMEHVQHAGDLRHLVRLGSLSALERTGHLLLELYERLTVAGLTHAAAMPLPLTQIQLADHLGLSAVHANRVLQQLRREGLIEMNPRQVVFRQLAELAARSCYELGTYSATIRPEIPVRVHA